MAGLTGVSGSANASVQKALFATMFKKRFRDQTLITRLTNQDWKGQFKGNGTELQVPCLPIISTKKRRKGEAVVYQDPESWFETFTINRERDLAFRVNTEDQLFSYLAIDSEYMAEGTRQMALDVDVEFFEDVPSKCHTKNQGNTAGYKSGAYTLGTAAAPLYIYETRADVVADSTSGRKKYTATKAITAMTAVLGEQPGGMDTKPFIVVPGIFANMLQNGDLNKADSMGDSVSVLRKSVQYLGEISGASIFACNQLPIAAATESLPQRYTCLFGDTSAITFADEVTIEENLKDKDMYGNFHRKLMIYDWFVRYPERLGSAVIATA